MEKSIEQFVNDAQELCVLPDVYSRLVALIDKEDTGLDEIAELISLEPALASSVLKMANSALFNFPKQIESINKAINVLGLKQITQLIHAYGITAAFSEIDTRIMDMDRFWEISVDCALLCRYMAKARQLDNQDSLFLSGLFHHLGALVLAHQVPEKVMYAEDYDKTATPYFRQKEALGFTYSQCSAVLLESWNVPNSIVKPISNLHSLKLCLQDDSSAILFVAARLALYNSHQGLYKKSQLIKAELADQLTLTDKSINDMLEQCNADGMSILSSLGVL